MIKKENYKIIQVWGFYNLLNVTGILLSREKNQITCKHILIMIYKKKKKLR